MTDKRIVLLDYKSSKIIEVFDTILSLRFFLKLPLLKIMSSLKNSYKIKDYYIEYLSNLVIFHNIDNKETLTPIVEFSSSISDCASLIGLTIL